MNNDENDFEDRTALRDPGMARTSVVAGVFGIVLAPLVIGFIPAAIGLHAGFSHIRHREGARWLARVGVALSVSGAIFSASAAIVWGSVLLAVLLQRSAIDQARQWEGTSAAAWSLTDLEGVAHTSGDLAGRIVLLDCFAPESPYCLSATTALATFAERHPEVAVFSWGSEVDAAEAKRFGTSAGVTHPIAIGPQSMPEPFSQVTARPTLFVIDGKGTIRSVLLGTYGSEDLGKLVEFAKTPMTPKPVTSRAAGAGFPPREDQRRVP